MHSPAGAIEQRWPLAEAALFIASVVVFWQAGFNGRLTPDSAFYFYAGRQLADGVPPYVSGFDHKGPGAAIILAAVVSVARLFDVTDTFHAARVALLFASGLVVVGIYRLCLPLVRSQRIAVIAALLTTTYSAFGLAASGGPNPATLILLLVTWSLVFAVRNQFGRAALCGTASGIVWQPTLFYGLFPVALAFVATMAGQQRSASFVRAAAGFVVPLAVLVAYFAAVGALGQLVGASIVFNLKHLDRGSPLYYNPFWIVRAVVFGFPEASGMIVMGLLAIPLVAFLRTKAEGVRNFLLRDPWRVLVLSLPVPAGWSLLDFQTADDFFVFIPYAAAGMAWILDSVAAAARASMSPAARRVLPMAAAVAVIAFAAGIYRLKATEQLAMQKALVHEIQAERGADTRILTINAPELLVLTGRDSLAPLLTLVPSGGMGSLIGDVYENAFDGLIAELEAAQPQMVVAGPIAGKGLKPLEAWLERRFTARQIATPTGPWRVFVAKPE